jgi:hypothetical protein
MLDTSLSDAEWYPLKLHDLIVFSTNSEKAPRTVQWGPDTGRGNIIKDIPNVGFSGDYLLRPLFIDAEWVSYDQIMLYVDPAGRGKDETAWAVIAQLNGLLYLLSVGGVIGDPASAMKLIALDCKKWRTKEVIVEPNYGGLMWIMAFQPILEAVYPGKCSVKESEWAKGQKEVRIIDTMEPVLTSHRLIVNEAILREDLKTDDRSYSLMYQLTHITRERGALTHDDRLDALAGGIAYYMASMAADVKSSAAQQKAAEEEALIEAFEDSLNGTGRLWRGRRSVLDDVPSEVWTGGFN